LPELQSFLQAAVLAPYETKPGRAATPRHNDCFKRPSPDDLKSLVLMPPPGAGQELRYLYRGGALSGAENKAGQPLADAFGIET
jgi:hypothetical protein